LTVPGSAPAPLHRSRSKGTSLTTYLPGPTSPRDPEAPDRRRDHLHVDDDDLLWRENAWCALSPIEATIVRTLIDRSPRVVSRAELGARVWPGGVPKGRPIDGRLHRLRARLEPLGVRIHSIRQRGLLLTVDPVAGAVTSS
jgi:DNA-binding winged helix-turn-helix (wHTH) protein